MTCTFVYRWTFGASAVLTAVLVIVPVALRGLDQRRHLVDREVLTGPELGVLSSFRRNCS
jgi:hypothetical protein